MTYRNLSVLVGIAAATAALAGCHHGDSTGMAPPPANEVAEFDNAVCDGDTDIIVRLISAKPEMINAKDENGKTPTAIALEKGDTQMADLLKKHGGHE